MSCILHIIPGYWPFVGGAQTYLRAMSERLAGDGHQVVVVTTDATGIHCFWDPRQPRFPEREITLGGVRVVRCPLAHLPLAPLSFYLLRRLAIELARLPLVARPLLRWLAQAMPRVPALEDTLENLPGFDLVHGVDIAADRLLLAGHRYARRHGVPFVVTPFVHIGGRAVQRYHTMPHQLAVLRDAEAVIVQTGLEARALAGLGVPEARLVRLGMGVDLDELRGGNGALFRAEQGIAGPVVTFLGALTDDKGIVHLLRAMQRLWDAGRQATLAIAGPAVVPSTFEQVYHALPEGHRQHIRRLGVVGGSLKQDLLAATDILALPSRVDSFGIVYLEAWAYGRPVIGCRAGGVPDVIEDGQDGLLVEFGDVAALAQAIEALLADPERRQAMGRRGRARVERHYTWDRLYPVLRGVYDQVQRTGARRASSLQSDRR